MIQDSSPNFEDTWAFLENRVADAMNMGVTAKQVRCVLCASSLMEGLIALNAVSLLVLSGVATICYCLSRRLLFCSVL